MVELCGRVSIECALRAVWSGACPSARSSMPRTLGHTLGGPKGYAVGCPCGNRDDAGQPADLDRRGSVSADSSDPELAAPVVSPRPDSAIRLQSERVSAKRGNGHDSCQPWHWSRGGVRPANGAIAEFADAIVAPRPDGAIILEGDTMARSRTDGVDAGERREVHRHKLCPSRGAEPQLSCCIVAPAPHGAISLDGQAMRASGGDGLRLGESTHRDRHIAGGRGAIPKLAPGIAAPGPGGAISLDR